MTAQSTDSMLIPTKFISIMLHLITVTMAYFSYHDNIVTAYPAVSLTTDNLYIGGRTSFLACNTITVIFLVIELIILFDGVTMFRERHNFINSSLHFLGAILWAEFIFQQWQFSQLWAIWAVCSFLPFIFEILAAISVSSK